MITPSEGWILWAGTTGFEEPLDERLEAAAAAGYGRVSLSPDDVARAERCRDGRPRLAGTT